MHVGEVVSGTVAVGAVAGMIVDRARLDTRRNHSATHLLHRALRTVLGTHVRQRGSMVSPERLRFDFSHMSALTPDEIARVEQLVQGWIFEDHPIVTREMSLEAAIAEGALHFFEDKYGEKIRMVKMGDSIELCGGTHAARTSSIGVFKIVSEGGISAGIRRIEALTGPAAVRYLMERDAMLGQVGQVLRVDGPQIVDKIEKLIDAEKSLRKELADLRVKAAAAGSAGPGAPKIMEFGGVKVMLVSADGMDKKGLRELSDVMRDKVGSGMVLITVVDGPKMAVALAVTADLQKDRPAGKVLNDILACMGGRGGGSPSLAQGAVDTPKDQGIILDALAKALQ
jgi:alanyl-tRNA synthetase